jgi:HNH endonuclease
LWSKLYQMKQDFKQVEYNNNYSVNTDGGIISTVKGKERILKGMIKPDGYKMYYLVEGGLFKRGRWFYAHRLVALAFIPNPLQLPEINHKDRNKINNNVSNLEWITHRDNVIHRHNSNK